MSVRRIMAHICALFSGDQTCSLILQRGQTVNAGTLPAKDDKAPERVGPGRSSLSFFTYMKPLSETTSRQAAFLRVNHRLTPRSKTLLDRTPSDSSDAQCGRFGASHVELTLSLHWRPFMNMRTLLMTSALACTAFAGLAQANDTSTSQAVPYHYGMPLHVGKVVALTEPNTLDCKVITAEMKYIDTSGKPAEITYRKLSDACSYQN